MRTLIAILVFLSSANALADESHSYEVKKGDGWRDVLKQSKLYQDRAGIGLDDLFTQIHGALKPGTQIRLASLNDVLSESGVFNEFPEATTLLDTRNFALKWVDYACGDGVPVSDVPLVNENAKEIWQSLRKLSRRAPWGVQMKLSHGTFVQLEQLVKQFDSPHTKRRQFQMPTACKNYIAILKRSGSALTELLRELAERVRARESRAALKSKLLREAPDMVVLLDASELVSKWRERICSEGKEWLLPADAISWSKDAKEIKMRLITLLKIVPESAQRKVKVFTKYLDQGPRRIPCKYYISLTKNTGNALAALRPLMR